MPNWSDPMEMKKDFEAAMVLFWFSVGFSLREQMSTSRFDWDVITGKRQRRWPQFFYFLVKLTWWGYVIANIVLVYTRKPIDCQGAMYAIESMMSVITLCSSILLACRTICVYQDFARKVVIGIISIFALGLAAAWGQGVNSVGAMWLPGQGQPWTEGACAFTGVRMDYSVKYIVTVTFDFLVLVLTVIGVYRLEGSTTKIGYILIRQGIVYFIATFVVNALIAGFTIAQLNPVMSLILAVPTSAIAVAASTRLYVELAEETRPLKDREVSFTKENEESYFGTVSGNSSDTRKRSMFRGMFRRTSSADPEKLGQILSLNLGTSSPLVEIHGPTPSQSANSGVFVVRAIAPEPIENLATPMMVQEAQQQQQHEARSRPSIDNNNASGPGSGTATPNGTPHRSHRKQPSFSVLPSAAAAAAGLRIEQSRTVTTEPMPVHLAGGPFPFAEPSSSQEDAVLKEFPGLSSRSSQGHGSGSNH
ncbi:hypothetical protein OC844_005712 [Tilletia horrida]|nr:hypothetical protein OC844_005712 [Tilletia horrida]